MSSDLNDFVWQYVIINQLLNQMLSCAVIYKFFLSVSRSESLIMFLSMLLKELTPSGEHLNHIWPGFGFSLLTARFRKIERRFIGHHACGPVLFVSQVGVDGAAICVTLVFVHFRFLLSNISSVFAGTRFHLSFNVKLDEAVSLRICF